MKKKLSEGLIEGLNILEKKYKAQVQHNLIQSARRLVEEDYINEYGLQNKKVRFKKDKKPGDKNQAIQQLESRKQMNSKIKIDLKTPLLEIHGEKGSKISKKRKDDPSLCKSDKNINLIKLPKGFSKTKSIISRSSKKSERSQMKSILGRLSNGDEKKQKYLIDLCRQNLNEQCFNEQDIFGIKGRHTTYQKANEQFQKKYVTKNFFSNPQSLKQTATHTKPQNSMQNSMDTSYVQQQQKKKSKIVINPLLFNYEDNPPNNEIKQKRHRIYKKKNCYSQSSGDA